MRTGLAAVVVGLALVAVAVWTLLGGRSAVEQVGSPPDNAPAVVETIRGVVVGVPSGGGGSRDSKGSGATGPTGPLITIRSAGEALKVHAGPPRFHSQIGLSLAVNDEIEVTGIRRRSAGTPILIAETLKKGDKVFKIRGESGEKLWQPNKRPPPELSAISGEVLSLAPEMTDLAPNRERSGMMVAVQTKDGKIVVQLGPESFRVKQGLVLAVGDHVEINGWPLPGAVVVDTPVMLAASIKKGDQSLRVRDEQRRALWPAQ